MIFELATIDVKPGDEDAFERGVAQALPLFQRARGYRSLQLERSFEEPSRYRLVVGWDTIEDHVTHFRNSQDFKTWRALVGHMFAVVPVVEHTAIVVSDLESQSRG